MVTTEVMTISLLLGLSASFAPCLFPVLPSFVSFLTKADTKKFNGIIAGLMVGLGIMTVFFILGIFINVLSSSILGPLERNYVLFRYIQGGLLVILGILLMMRLKLSSGRLASAIDKIQGSIEKQSNPWVMAYSIGLAFTILAAPCAIVTFITFFQFVALNPGFTNLLVLNLLFTIGASTPFLIMGSLIPSLKDTFMKNQDRVFYLLPLISGILILGSGLFLIADGMGLIS